jgi:anti-sigma-K factor RskA
MGRELTHAELQQLLGAYALDAVEEAESHTVEDHLETCGPCRAEVAEHREVAALMASGWRPAPEGLWDRIAGSLEETPPAMRPVMPLDAARQRRRRLWSARPVRAVAAAGVAAAVTVAAMLGYTLAGSRGGESEVASVERSVAVAAEEAARQAGARTVELRSMSGALTADAVLLADGTGYLVNANLPNLPPDRTYQLWAVIGQEKISVGVLGPRVGPTAFNTTGNVAALAITEEVAGGVVVSTATPAVVGVVA